MKLLPLLNRPVDQIGTSYEYAIVVSLLRVTITSGCSKENVKNVSSATFSLPRFLSFEIIRYLIVSYQSVR